MADGWMSQSPDGDFEPGILLVEGNRWSHGGKRNTVLRHQTGLSMGGLLMAILLSALACLFASPTMAVAAEYTVNSVGDQADAAPGSDGCMTTSATCTLRAAIEESNASTGVIDTIKFSTSFNGQIGDTIELATSLPVIVDRVAVRGAPAAFQCQTDYFSLPGPCVGIDGPTDASAFRIEAEQVALSGFAISNAQTAIEAVGGPGLRALNNWLGIALDGSAGPLHTGISIDQNSNGAWIGGSSSTTRNIFAHIAGVGLDLEGADNAIVRGNGFGVLPDGNSTAANDTNIEITDSAVGENRVANGNLIGGTLNDKALSSPTCDGACNVVSAALESGIDLAGDDLGEEPASGSTRILGNHIGLNAFGTTAIPNTQHGVLVGPADDVTVGGPRPGDRNVINGGANGVLAGPNASNLTIEGNWIGLDSSGKKLFAPPASRGIEVESSLHAEISANRISMTSGTAIEQVGWEAVIRSNAIGKGINGEALPGGSTGIHLHGSCFRCGLVHDNSITNASKYGILIENSRNHIFGNRINASGTAGIRIEDSGHGFAVDNVIGGDTAAEGNTISTSGGAAIQIVRGISANRRNEVARNTGTLNGGLFIDLINGANEGIQPPIFSSTTRSGGSGGSAVPGAVIRVFRKAGNSPGEIDGFLGETVADESGGWAVAYPSPIPGGTIVAASQTGAEEGTSELAFATTAAEPDSEDGEGDIGVAETPGQGPASAPAPTPSAPIALVRGKVLVRGSKVLVRVACRRGSCKGMLKVLGRRPVRGGRATSNSNRDVWRQRGRLVLMGKRRFLVAPGATRIFRVPLNRTGRILVRRAGRRGLTVRLSGRGVRNRIVRLRWAGKAKRRSSRRSRIPDA